MQVGSILVFIGWFIQATFELACIQCTSPLRRVPQMRDHSCLDGTLAPVPCAQSIHASKNYKNCISVLYNGGVLIHRGCSMIAKVRHECDPPLSTSDFNKTLDLFCSWTCSTDGCNQHSVSEISSNANGYLYENKILLRIYFIIWTKIYLFLIE